MKIVEINDTVKVHYTCITSDGQRYSTRDTYNPIVFKIGEGKMLKAIEEGVIGMKVNSVKTISIPHELAYGNWEQDKVKEVDRSVIPDIIELKKGLELYLSGADGKEIKLRIIEVKDKIIIIDENHILAGKDLVFEIEIIEIE
jgi:peptidylprolyl isomerase